YKGEQHGGNPCNRVTYKVVQTDVVIAQPVSDDIDHGREEAEKHIAYGFTVQQAGRTPHQPQKQKRCQKRDYTAGNTGQQPEGLKGVAESHPYSLSGSDNCSYNYYIKYNNPFKIRVVKSLRQEHQQGKYGAEYRDKPDPSH